MAEEGFTLPPLSRLKWLAIDLDGTLAEGLWTFDNPTSHIGAPIRGNLVKLREAERRGFKAVLHTSRPWSDYEAIEAWCNLHDVPARRIQCGKILAAGYVDDKAIHESEASWLPK